MATGLSPKSGFADGCEVQRTLGALAFDAFRYRRAELLVKRIPDVVQFAQAVLADFEVQRMPRKLKTYQTTLGFFDLAVAAPSMKAALEAWGSKNNLFPMGFAKESNDKAVIAATMEKPGVVLRRAVGSADKFSEHAELPDSLPDDDTGRESKKLRRQSTEVPQDQKPDDNNARRAARAFEREQARREQERQKL